MNSKQYFSDLNYSLGNEDTGFEVELLKELKPKKILSIAGCGSRLLPLTACAPDLVIGLDVAIQQLYITKLREECIKTFDHNDYLLFWGFPPYGAYDYGSKRKKLFQSLKLEADVKDYFTSLFEKHSYGPLLYLGKWEKTFAILSQAVRLLLGKEAKTLFEFDQLDEQIEYYHSKFPMKKWKSIIFMLGNKSVFNALLYRGDFIKKNVPESHFDYYFENFQRLFTQGLARESFFAHLCFFGKLIHEDGNTIEADEAVYVQMQKALRSKTQIDLVSLDLFSAADKYKGHNLDFLSLSDVPSYFSGESERLFLQKCKETLSPEGVIVVRSYLREPEAMLDGLVDITPKFGHLIARERVQMYRIKIYQRGV